MRVKRSGSCCPSIKGPSLRADVHVLTAKVEVGSKQDTNREVRKSTREVTSLLRDTKAKGHTLPSVQDAKREKTKWC